MVRRSFDIFCAVIGLIFCGPAILAAVVAIRLSSPGPAFYRAHRIGRHGRPFTMYKLRTMHCRPVLGSSITSADDPRVFPVGRLLRALKIDELPQLLNVLKGEMAIVGPRPEAADIVRNYYTYEYNQSLTVRPGLTSPGSIAYYTHGEHLLANGNAEDFYVQRLLPLKMAMDLNYVKTSTFLTDLGLIARTASVLIQKALGRRLFPTPPQLAAFLEQSRVDVHSPAASSPAVNSPKPPVMSPRIYEPDAANKDHAA